MTPITPGELAKEVRRLRSLSFEVEGTFTLNVNPLHTQICDLLSLARQALKLADNLLFTAEGLRSKLNSNIHERNWDKTSPPTQYEKRFNR